MSESENTTKMVIPCQCPHCEGMIVVALDTPHPTAEVMTPEQVPDDIKGLIYEQNDSTKATHAEGFSVAQGDDPEFSEGQKTTD